VDRYREWRNTKKERDEAKAILDDPSPDPVLREIAQEDLPKLDAKLEEALGRLRDVLVTEDEDSARDAIVEIQAGVGGDEASLFAGDLFRMYSRYAQTKGWTVELYDQNEGNQGGLKSVTFGVQGERVYGRLRFESGVHRVQRVPQTETQGRIHTSTAAVVVLPEVDDLGDVAIPEKDVRIDKFSAGGPGGQHVNKTQSAVRLTHLPSGIVVQCQDERSQIKNLAKAWKALRARVADELRSKQEKERGDTRRSLRGRAQRNEKIRTYNFPQNRVTDHRINVSIHDLPKILDGALDPLVEKLLEHDRKEGLEAL
jgi:peptide chain release factor 1